MKTEVFNKENFALENIEDLGYLMGFIIGDGNLSSKYLVRAVEENEKFVREVFVRKFSNVFNREPKVYFDAYNNSYVAYVNSKAIWMALRELGIPSGDKSKTVRVPQSTKNNSKMRRAIASGLFDAEGSIVVMKDSHHKNGYPRIQLKVHNHGLAEDIFEILESEGIKSKLYNYAEFSMIQINGKKQLSVFSDRIGFQHPIKAKKLSVLL